MIEIRPHRWGLESFEAPGVEPVFPEKDQAINYAQNRASFRSGEIHVFDLTANVERKMISEFLRWQHHGAVAKDERLDARLSVWLLVFKNRRSQRFIPPRPISCDLGSDSSCPKRLLQSVESALVSGRIYCRFLAKFCRSRTARK
jgi:hypothetical protein